MQNENYISFRKKAAYLLDPGSSESGWAYFVDFIISTLVIVNIAALAIDTVPDIPYFYKEHFVLLELITVGFFSVEYVLRIWIAKDVEPYKYKKLPRLSFITSYFGIIDFLAVVPFYAFYIFGVNYYFLLVLRLFRLLKLIRYFKALQLMGRVLKSKRQELFVAVFFIFVLLVFVSFLMYYVEHKAQPEVFSSVPAAMWWGIITLTTVGYGDVYPITSLGKVLGGFIALLGIGLFALPAGILAGGFSSELKAITDDAKTNENLKIKHVCPHCGKEHD
jgi:voltage-gated potassium channel